MAEGAPEGVARAEAVDDVDGGGRHLGGAAVAVDGEDALGALFDDGEFHAGLQQGAGAVPRFPYAGGDFGLVEVADRDGGVGERGLVVGARGSTRGRLGRAGRAAAPEHGAPVEVEDGGGPAGGRGAGFEGGEGGGAAGLLAQPGARHPEDAGRANGVQVQLVRADVQVGGLGEAVEVQREVVGREDLAEGDGGGEAVHGGDPPVVHAEVAQRLVDVVAEGVRAGAADDGGAAAEAGGGDRDVGGGAAEDLPKVSTRDSGTPVWSG